jgi:hypothetical protein
VSRLRIGVLTAAPERAEAWERELVRRIAADDRMELACVILADSAPGPAAGGLYGLVRRIDRAAFGREPASPGYAALTDVRRLSLEEALADPAALGLDVLVEAADLAAAAPLRAAARHGAWTFDFCLAQAVRADLTGFWEAARRAPLTPAALVRRADGGTELLAETAFNTKFSGARNAAYLKVRMVSLMLRELRRLALDGAAPAGRAYAPSAPRTPSAGQVLAYGVGVVRELATRASMAGAARLGLRPDMWALYLGQGAAPFVSAAAARRIEPYAGELWADPFLWREGEALYVFFENYDYATRLGRISVGRLEDGELHYLGDALKLEHHLSYPFVFRHDGQLYMMPERHQADRVEVWRCVEFPLKWELHATALEGRSPADSLMHFDGASWWLFTNLTEKLFADHCAELHVFQVDGPDLKSVVPHAANPVVIGSELARNGGRIFTRDGRLFRPAQLNTHGVYGYGLNVMEITELSLERYAETRVHRIVPDHAPGLKGCHHMDVNGETWVLDICHRLGGRGRPAQPVVRF